MTNVYQFGGAQNVGRASRAWWLRRIRSAIGLVGFAAAMVFAFFVATTNPVQEGRGFALRQPYYHHCADARAAGAAPIHRGEPGYRSALDSDDDGVACEPYDRR